MFLMGKSAGLADPGVGTRPVSKDRCREGEDEEQPKWGEGLAGPCPLCAQGLATRPERLASALPGLGPPRCTAAGPAGCPPPGQPAATEPFHLQLLRLGRLFSLCYRADALRFILQARWQAGVLGEATEPQLALAPGHLLV